MRAVGSSYGLVLTFLNNRHDVFDPVLTLLFTALDARLEVGLEQQAELMLKMMATLQADSILQALTSNSSTGTQQRGRPLVKTLT